MARSNRRRPATWATELRIAAEPRIAPLPAPAADGAPPVSLASNTEL